MKEERENYDNFIIPLFNNEIMHPIFNRKVGIVYNLKKNIYGISVESVNIEKPLNYLGIPTGIKNELQIPKWIEKNKDYSISFIRGFFDTDGTISCQRNYSIKNNKYHTQIRLGITSTSKELILKIWSLLKTFVF